MRLKHHSNRRYTRCLRILCITIRTREVNAQTKQLENFLSLWNVEVIIAVYPDFISFSPLSYQEANHSVLTGLMVSLLKLLLCFLLFAPVAFVGFSTETRPVGCGEYQFNLSSRGNRRPSFSSNEKGKISSFSFLSPRAWVWFKLKSN